jgi:hypothetical protein
VRLADRSFARYLHSRTQGSIGELVNLIRLAADLALKRDAEDPSAARGLTLDLFEEITLSHGAEERRPARPAKPSGKVRSRRARLVEQR